MPKPKINYNINIKNTDMIKTEKLTKVFSTEEIETFALNGVDVHVKKGEFVAIMGPSGCGKSTLLNIVGLLDNPTEGTYIFNGTDVSNLKEKEFSDDKPSTLKSPLNKLWLSILKIVSLHNFGYLTCYIYLIICINWNISNTKSKTFTLQYI